VVWGFGRDETLLAPRELAAVRWLAGVADQR
jgi:hypothetical protein